MTDSSKKKGPRLYSRPLRGKKALGIIHELVEFCRFYVFNSETDPKEKRQWIKTLSGLLSTNATMLRDLDHDAFEKRVSLLEEFHDEEIFTKKIGKA